MTEHTPHVAMSVALDSAAETVSATVTIDGLGPGYEATADAPRSHQDPPTDIEFELAVSRALLALEHRIMERVHERIDRSTDDV